MKLYSALIKKNKDGKIEDITLLKEGFSFYAFLFGPLWFLYHKMWQEFTALLALNIAFGIFGDITSGFDKIFLEIALVFAIALNATHWLCDNLKKRNYQFVGLVFGSDLANAKLRFIKNLAADFSEFDDSILNPKLHCKMTKFFKRACS